MLKRVKKVFELEASTGILLLIATTSALLLVNSGGFAIYHDFFMLKLPLNLKFVKINQDLTLHDWINDALMAIFFLLVGMELKEEVASGELSSKARVMLPLLAACGGVIAPALIFYFYNINYQENLRGFAIPTATDIAFAYGVICLFGKKIPKSLKVFLISLAIFDDLSAIAIIALFYSQSLELSCLTLALLVMGFLTFLNYKESTNPLFYASLGIILWILILKSGIHATITGVILAMFIPRQKNFLYNSIKKIAPIVNFLILPIFAFANSGVRIEKLSIEIFNQPLVLAIILALFFGKQFGVMLFSFLAIKLKLANMPRGSNGAVSWLNFYGVAILTGIGFTMSFFIGSLAFNNNNILFDQVKIGVLAGSFLSAVFGMLVIGVSLGLSKRR